MDNIEHARATLELMQTWSIWLVGIETAALGFLGILYRHNTENDKCAGFKKNEHIPFIFTAVFFGLSLVFAVILNGGIPSASNQLLFLDCTNQIPEESIFAFEFPRIFGVRLFWWGHWQAIFFVLGIICLACTIGSYANNRKS